MNFFSNLLCTLQRTYYCSSESSVTQISIPLSRELYPSVMADLGTYRCKFHPNHKQYELLNFFVLNLLLHTSDSIYYVEQKPSPAELHDHTLSMRVWWYDYFNTPVVSQSGLSDSIVLTFQIDFLVEGTLLRVRRRCISCGRSTIHKVVRHTRSPKWYWKVCQRAVIIATNQFC